MKSFLIGKSVSSVFGKTIRYGLVESVKVENEWVYLKCDWVEDGAYKNDIRRKSKLRNTPVNESADWIRVDKVNFIDIKNEINKLSRLSQKKISIVGSDAPWVENNEKDVEYFLTESSNRHITL